MTKNRKTLNPFLWLVAILLVALLVPVLASAQTVDETWSGPRRLSNPGVEAAAEAAMVADEYGVIHLIWTEVDPDDTVNTVNYTIFDGEIWEPSIDIRAALPGLTISSYDSVIVDDRIYAVWTEGTSGPVYLSSAPVRDSMSFHNWARPIRIDIPAYRLKMAVDSQGVMHIMFVNYYGREPGIYYTYSEDRGLTWSNSRWIDPDIPTSDSPNVLQFAIDDKDGLHASWYYVNLDSIGGYGEIIRYTHSLDGGKTWSTPFVMDVNDDADDELRLPYPGLAVAGDTVHMIWAGTTETYREHRYSLDRGVTWSETNRIFGRLQGQALGDALTADASGRLHFFGQIRWPQFIYHVSWTAESGWSNPEGIYLIARDGNEGRQGRYHAHALRAGVRAGNQLVVAFTDEAVGPLYVMWKTLTDVAPVAIVPTPTPLADIQATPTAVPAADEPTRIPLPPGSQNAPLDPPSTGNGVWLGVIPALVLVAGVFLFYFFRTRRFS